MAKHKIFSKDIPTRIYPNTVKLCKVKAVYRFYRKSWSLVRKILADKDYILLSINPDGNGWWAVLVGYIGNNPKGLKEWYPYIKDLESKYGCIYGYYPEKEILRDVLIPVTPTVEELRKVRGLYMIRNCLWDVVNDVLADKNYILLAIEPSGINHMYILGYIGDKPMTQKEWAEYISKLEELSSKRWREI